MSENSKIEWTDHTFNPWIGCTKVSPGCANCYAETQDKFRSWTPEGWGKGKPRKRTSEANWKKPLQWNKAAEGAKVRPRVFCASLADWLDDEVPIEWLCDLLALIRSTPNLDWLLLTKRPENWKNRIGEAAFHARTNGGDMSLYCEWGHNQPPENVWIGTTVEDQKRADERIPELLKIPARIRFLSCEPLLEKVNLLFPPSVFPDGPEYCCNGAECGCYGLPQDPPYTFDVETGATIHWVIAGGESGSSCREFDPMWARSLKDQCQMANMAFFMKQMGGTRKPFDPIPEDLMIREFPKVKGGYGWEVNPWVWVVEFKVIEVKGAKS